MPHYAMYAISCSKVVSILACWAWHFIYLDPPDLFFSFNSSHFPSNHTHLISRSSERPQSDLVPGVPSDSMLSVSHAIEVLTMNSRMMHEEVLEVSFQLFSLFITSFFICRSHTLAPSCSCSCFHIHTHCHSILSHHTIHDHHCSYS